MFVNASPFSSVAIFVADITSTVVPPSPDVPTPSCA
jgi:hypothetical protein